MNMNTGIIIALNNTENIFDFLKIEDFLDTNKNIHICFVNNGSTDDTQNILKLCEEKFEDRISVVSIKKKKGVEAAIKIGFRYLLNKMNFTSISFSNHLNFNNLTSASNFQKNILAID